MPASHDAREPVRESRSSGRLQALLARLAPVQPDEWGRVLPVVLANFLLIAGVTIGRNVRDSLFLKNFGVANLPYMYLASAVLVVACSSVYARFVGRVDRLRFVTLSFGAYAVSLVASTVLLAGGYRWLYPALYMLVQALWILSIMQFWTAAGDMFDTRQAKRLFPFLASGGLLGMIATGLVIRPAVRLFGTGRLLLLWVVCLVAAMVLLRRSLARYRLADSQVSKKPRPQSAPARQSWVAEALEGFRLVRGTRLAGVMSGIALTLWVVFVLVDFQFSRVMNAAYPTQDALTAFLGSFRAWAGLAALVVQLFLTPRLVARLGVGRTILFHPAGLVLLTGGLLAWYGYATAFAAKFIDHVLLWSIQDASFQLLYNPLAPERRARTVAFVDGNLKPLSNGLAGILLIAAATMHWPPWAVSLAAMLVASLWLLSASKIGGAYLEALLADLVGQFSVRGDPSAALARLRDPESLERLFAAMKSATPAQALLAIHLLERLDDPKAQNLLGRLAAHPDPVIRATAVAALGRSRQPTLLSLLSQVATDSDARVRANALQRLQPENQRAETREVLRICLEDENRRVRSNAIRAYARLRQADGDAAADQELRRLLQLCELMCADPDPATRHAGAYAVAGLPTRFAQPLLLRLLADAQRLPWRQELRSLARVGDEAALEAVLHAGRHQAAALQTFRAVRHIHRRRPAPALARLVELLRAVESTDLRPQVLMALGSIADAGALPALVELLASPNPQLQTGALEAIDRISQSAPLPDELRPAVRATAEQTAESLATTLSYSRSIDVHLPSQAAWLKPFLADEAARIQKRIFLALGIVTDRQRMASIARQLQSGAGRRERANALEALEVLAGPALGRRLGSLLEAEKLPVPALGGVLQSLAAHESTAIRASLAKVVGEARLTDCEELLGVLRRSADYAVREATMQSLWRLWGEDAAPLVRRALDDPHPAIRRSAKAILEGTPMLLTVEKMLFLKSVPLFASLEGNDLVSLSEICAEQEMPAGSAVFHENEEGNQLYVIVEGKVKVFRGEDAAERQLAELGERECFGEMALLDSELRSASVATLEPCRFLVINGDDFRDLILNHPKISLAILRLLSQRLRKADEMSAPAAVYTAAQGYM